LRASRTMRRYALSSSFETARGRRAPQDEGSVLVWLSLGILPMTIADKLVLQRQHHLKWRSFDRLELVLMIICGILCFGFSLSVMCDIVTRTIGHPWLWLQEVTSTLFIYAIFVGARSPPGQRSSVPDGYLGCPARHAAADRRDRDPPWWCSASRSA